MRNWFGLSAVSAVSEQSGFGRFGGLVLGIGVLVFGLGFPCLWGVLKSNDFGSPFIGFGGNICTATIAVVLLIVVGLAELIAFYGVFWPLLLVWSFMDSRRRVFLKLVF